MSAPPCPFCQPDQRRVFHEGRRVRGLWDGYPVSPGHALLVPRRHVGAWFELDADERVELAEATDAARAAILARHQRPTPDGFNLGVNDGEAAGQTVRHVHLHVIPRYAGDVADPRGGVRWVLPERADYWSARDRR